MEEALIKKIMPHSIDAEQSVIGAMMMDKEAVLVASEMLTQEDFYGKQYGILFEAMVEMHNENKPVDLVTLKEKLKEKDVPEELGSIEFLRETLEALPTTANVKYYVNIVHDKALLRKMIRMTEEISNDCYSGKDATEDILDSAEKKVFKLVQSQTSGDYEPISNIVVKALKKIELAAKTGSAVTGIPTGFADLDSKTAGLQNSDFILIAARPSMGKTAFVLNLAEHICLKEDVATLIFSLEMPKEQLINRLFSQEARVNAQNLRTGDLPDSDWEKLIEAVNVIGKSKLIIDDTSGISVAEMRSKCRKYKMEHNIGLVIIDYLQLMTGSKKSESRQQEISDISRSLKGIAREINVPVIALSQLSRAVEQRPNHRPMLSDLRESGAIEQDADVAMFLYRDDYYNPETEEKGVTEVIIAKQRNGPIGTVKLLWLPEYTKFVNYEYKSDY